MKYHIFMNFFALSKIIKNKIPEILTNSVKISLASVEWIAFTCSSSCLLWALSHLISILLLEMSRTNDRVKPESDTGI